MIVLPYDPGVIPTAPSPTKGHIVEFYIDGLPPYKDLNQSIRNSKHKAHDRFISLRKEATKAMAGRAWSFD